MYTSIDQPSISDRLKLQMAGPARRLAACALALVPIVVILGWVLVTHVFALMCALVLYGAASGLAVSTCGAGHHHPRLGFANIVTQIRLAMVAALSVCIFVPTAHPYLVLAIAALTLALDGIDGWLARRADTVSSFGARFDMEVDAAFAAILAVILLTSGTVGPMILLLGGMRYGYVLASRVWPALRRPLPDRFRRKAICVLQIATLIFLLIPGLSGSTTLALTLLATCALSASFLCDIVWQLRARG